MARHLAGSHGVRHLLLVSRSGMEAAGAKELKAALGELGAKARIVACDVTDRQALAKLISGIPKAHPLTGVIHAAGVADNGLVGSLDGECLRRVMAPKVDAAISLHELTEDLDLSMFVLFSSVAGVWGGPGQGNYAAANTFLDAFASFRRAGGLPAVSLAWGPWERASGLTAGMSEDELNRVAVQTRAHMAMSSLSDEQGLELFDLSTSMDGALLVPARLEMSALRAQAKAGMLPALVRTLVRTSARVEQVPSGSLRRRLGQRPESEWDQIILDLVLTHVAAVLGHSSQDAIDPTRPFKEARLRFAQRNRATQPSQHRDRN